MDRGMRARINSRILNEILESKKKILLIADQELKESSKKLDYSTREKQTAQTSEFMNLLKGVLIKERKKGLLVEDVISIFKLIACGQIDIQEKKDIVELMHIEDSSKLKLLHYLDKFDDQDTYQIGIRDTHYFHYGDKELAGISEFLYDAFFSPKVDSLKSRFEELEDSKNITDISPLSLLLWALDPKEFYIIDQVALFNIHRVFRVKLPSNPYNYPDLDDVFYQLRLKLELPNYGALDFFLDHYSGEK